ncbi:MAG TPA: 23S rRNA (adenine(2503)-C(2))-methyltransferase RlmN, partial [Gemmataceae bacterium]|nr:23S rRNA (adenine(2503)-C(2))-methyltransferase RlmN [Gemmataceae bacterium]
PLARPAGNRYNACMELPTLNPPPAVHRGLLELSRDELLAWLQAHGQPPLRARQLRRWIVVGRAASFDQMTDLPRGLREQLADEFSPLGATVDRRLSSSDGTQKLLLRLHDGNVVECVLLPERDRRTVCISTQVGCGMGCVFCASGIGGVLRNLSAAEILEQLLHARNLLPERERLTNIVVMGMGEPMANLDALLEALATATAADGLGVGARHVTISTVGVPVKIRRLADLGKQYHLAVSLHAPNDELRNRIVPTNEKVGLAAILDAADYLFERTGRQVTYEYVLLRDWNDRPAHAAELGGLLRGRQAHVNLIPFNDVAGLPYRRPTQEAISDFTAILKQHGVSVKVRKRKGADIEAACGQLRRSALNEAPSPPTPLPQEERAEAGAPEPVPAAGV